MKVKLATCASVFGAALATMFVAPELQADVVSLTFIPGTNPFSSTAGGTAVFMPEVGASFFQFNNALSPGRSMLAYSLSSISVVQVSQTLSPSMFYEVL